MNHREFVSTKYGKGTVAKYLEKHNLFQECIEWLKIYYPRETFSIPIPGRPSKNRTHIDVLQHMQRKLDMGLGYWDDSIKFMGEAFTAVISKNIAFAVHPTQDRFFSIRELLHLMGMPHDFQLENPKRNINHLCQNVPVNTAADWASEVVKFCRGEAQMTEYTFLRQDNTNQTISDSLPPQQPKVKPEGERGARVNTIKSEQRARTVASMRRMEPISKRDRSEWFDDAPPVASYSSEEESVWELEHQFYQEVNNKKVKMEDEVEVEIKEEEFKPTKKMLTRILEEYQQSVKKSTVGGQLQKFANTKDDSYKCGLCGYEVEMEEKLNIHWKIGCELLKVEEKHGKVEAYQCSGCGARKESLSLIERHVYFECQGLTKLPLDMTKLMAN